MRQWRTSSRFGVDQWGKEAHQVDILLEQWGKEARQVDDLVKQWGKEARQVDILLEQWGKEARQVDVLVDQWGNEARQVDVWNWFQKCLSEMSNMKEIEEGLKLVALWKIHWRLVHLIRLIRQYMDARTLVLNFEAQMIRLVTF